MLMWFSVSLHHTLTLWTRYRLNGCAHLYQAWQTCQPCQENEPYRLLRSDVKFKVTIDIPGNKLVNMIETKPLCGSLSNLADMFTTVRGWTLMILEVKGQGHSGHGNRPVNTIETKPLCTSSSHFADMLTKVRRWTLLILELHVIGQRSRS